MEIEDRICREVSCHEEEPQCELNTASNQHFLSNIYTLAFAHIAATLPTLAADLWKPTRRVPRENKTACTAC